MRNSLTKTGTLMHEAVEPPAFCQNFAARRLRTRNRVCRSSTICCQEFQCFRFGTWEMLEGIAESQRKQSKKKNVHQQESRREVLKRVYIYMQVYTVEKVGLVYDERMQLHLNTKQRF